MAVPTERLAGYLGSPGESGTLLPPTNSGENPPLSPIRFFPHGLIDIRPPDKPNGNKEGRRYEEHGMRFIDGFLHGRGIFDVGGIAIGTNLLDAATQGTELERGGNGRPDVIVIDANGTIIEIHEFKMLSRIPEGRLEEKLRRVSLLLQHLRLNPERLPELINKTVGQEILRGPLFIPPDEELSFVFVSTTLKEEGEVLTADGTSLKGSFITLPFNPRIPEAV